MSIEENKSLVKKDSAFVQRAMNQISATNKILANIAEKLPKEYFEKGEFYFNKNDYKEAIKWYSKALDLKPEFIIAYCKRGYSKALTDDFQNSIIDFDMALKLKADYADAYLGRGNANLEIKDYKSCVEDYTELIKLVPGFTQIHKNLGLIKSRIFKDFEGAIMEFDVVIQHDPGDAEVYLDRGASKINLGDSKGACIDWHKAKELGKIEAADLIEKFCN